MQNFHTTAGIFIAILLGYLGLTLALGAKRVYFEPFKEKPDENKPNEDTTEKENDPLK